VVRERLIFAIPGIVAAIAGTLQLLLMMWQRSPGGPELLVVVLLFSFSAIVFMKSCSNNPYHVREGQIVDKKVLSPYGVIISILASLVPFGYYHVAKSTLYGDEKRYFVLVLSPETRLGWLQVDKPTFITLRVGDIYWFGSD